MFCAIVVTLLAIAVVVANYRHNRKTIRRIVDLTYRSTEPGMPTARRLEAIRKAAQQVI